MTGDESLDRNTAIVLVKDRLQKPLEVVDIFDCLVPMKDCRDLSECYWRPWQYEYELKYEDKLLMSFLLEDGEWKSVGGSKTLPDQGSKKQLESKKQKECLMESVTQV